MKKYIGLVLLVLMGPIYLVLALAQVCFYGVSKILFTIYNFMYFPIYNVAGKPFDQIGEWKWNKSK